MKLALLLRKLIMKALLSFNPLVAGGASHAIAKVTITTDQGQKYEALLVLNRPMS